MFLPYLLVPTTCVGISLQKFYFSTLEPRTHSRRRDFHPNGDCLGQQLECLSAVIWLDAHTQRPKVASHAERTDPKSNLGYV